MIFFLDFDGVLHPFFPRADLPDEMNAHFSFVGAFEAAARQCPDADIVITSTWRNKYSLSELKTHFSADIADRIIGATPKVGPGHGDGGRQVEVEAWLEQNGRQHEEWVGIDDFPELYSPGAAVVACHDQFSQRETEHLIQAYSSPADYASQYPVPHSNSEKTIILSRPGLSGQ